MISFRICRLFFLHSYLFSTLYSISQTKGNTLYLIPGISADGRIFKNLTIEDCDTIILEFLIPEKNELLPAYARRMAARIDTTKPFSIAGVSFGGMIAVEMSKFLHPEKIFLISSAKTRSELPWDYRILKYVPLHKLFGGSSLNKLANIMRPLYEPESRQQTPVFRAMTDDTPPKLIQRSVHCIVNWENETYNSDVVHIQGEKDHTLPIRHIKNPVKIKGGSHEMALIRAQEVSEIINCELKGL